MLAIEYSDGSHRRVIPGLAQVRNHPQLVRSPANHGNLGQKGSPQNKDVVKVEKHHTMAAASELELEDDLHPK
jgi:hypothetical protein